MEGNFEEVLAEQVTNGSKGQKVREGVLVRSVPQEVPVDIVEQGKGGVRAFETLSSIEGGTARPELATFGGSENVVEPVGFNFDSRNNFVYRGQFEGYRKGLPLLPRVLCSVGAGLGLGVASLAPAFVASYFLIEKLFTVAAVTTLIPLSPVAVTLIATAGLGVVAAVAAGLWIFNRLNPRSWK